MLYNWQETPIPGACNDQMRCDYATFVQFLQESSLTQEQYASICGDTPKQTFEKRVEKFAAT